MENKVVIDNYQYSLGVDTKGNIGYVKQAQDIVFSILKEIDRICRKNDIPYALTTLTSSLGMMMPMSL